MVPLLPNHQKKRCNGHRSKQNRFWLAKIAPDGAPFCFYHVSLLNSIAVQGKNQRLYSNALSPFDKKLQVIKANSQQMDSILLVKYANKSLIIKPRNKCLLSLPIVKMYLFNNKILKKSGQKLYCFPAINKLIKTGIGVQQG